MMKISHDAHEFSSIFQIFLGVSLGVGIIAGLMMLCVFYLGLFVLGRYGRVRHVLLDPITKLKPMLKINCSACFV